MLGSPVCSSRIRGSEYVEVAWMIALGSPRWSSADLTNQSRSRVCHECDTVTTAQTKADMQTHAM